MGRALTNVSSTTVMRVSFVAAVELDSESTLSRSASLNELSSSVFTRKRTDTCASIERITGSETCPYPIPEEIKISDDYDVNRSVAYNQRARPTNSETCPYPIPEEIKISDDDYDVNRSVAYNQRAKPTKITDDASTIAAIAYIFNQLLNRAKSEGWYTIANSASDSKHKYERIARVKIIRYLRRIIPTPEMDSDDAAIALHAFHYGLGCIVLEQAFGRHKPLMADYPEYWIGFQQPVTFLKYCDNNDLYVFNADSKIVPAKGCYRAGHKFWQNKSTFETLLADMFKMARYSNAVSEWEQLSCFRGDSDDSDDSCNVRLIKATNYSFR